MRTIKFRGKQSVNLTHKWIIGSLIKELDGAYCIYSDGEKFSVIEESIGEFTGLLDKQEKEIYEGDIVNELRINKSFPGGRIIKRVIKWEDNMTLDDSYGETAVGFNLFGGQLEIIGNIHEHSELLKP